MTNLNLTIIPKLMKRTTLLFSVLLTYLAYSNVNAQCTLVCYAEINLALNASGYATISVEDVLASYGPACGTLIVEPSSFDCSDIGAPIVYTVTDLESGNTCWGNIHVKYFGGAMSCYANLNVDLGPSGNVTLTPDMLLLDPPGACIPGAIISPSTVSCANIGTPVLVTITDPVSGNSCWSTLEVEDPRPSSCEIMVPGSILCGDSGVPFSVNVSGGYGPFEYAWEIKGNPHGWSILTGHGTDNITMAVGDRKIKLEVTIIDVCGKKRKCSANLECEPTHALFDPKQFSLGAVSLEEVNNGLELFPNPAAHSLFVNFPEGISIEKSKMYIVDQLGRPQVSAKYQQKHKGKMSIDVEELQPGIYWLILEDVDSGPRIKKFIKR